MPTPVKIAVVGAGTMAQAVHLPVLRRRWDRFAIAALVDISERRRREASDVWGVPAERRFETVADLVAAVRARTLEIDAVVLSTDGLHVEDVLAIIRRGIPVLVEPPLGFSAEEIARVADFERMTGRRLVMMAYPQAHEALATGLPGRLPRRDLRTLEHEVLMPAAQPLFGAAHVTVSAYDLPGDLRTQRREALQAAVEAGSGTGALQRDRDLYVKGILTGIAHQIALLEDLYGPLDRIEAVRQWPAGVIPGSIEVTGRLEGDAPVRLSWHYLPFAPEHVETITLTSARRRFVLDLPAPSFHDRRAVLSLRERDAGAVQETRVEGATGSAEAMWEDFHAFVTGKGEIRPGAAEELRRIALLRDLLARIVAQDGRDIDPAPEPEPEPETQPVPETQPAPEPEPAPAAGVDAAPIAAAESGAEPSAGETASAVAPADDPAPSAESAPDAPAETPAGEADAWSAAVPPAERPTVDAERTADPHDADSAERA